jgi:hypothetical protein
MRVRDDGSKYVRGIDLEEYGSGNPICALSVQGRRRQAPWWQDASGLMLDTMRKSEFGRHFGGSRSAGAPYFDTSTIVGSGTPVTAACVSGESAGLSFGITGCTF